MQILVCLGGIWLIFMPIIPLKLIGGELYESVSILIKMSKVVKMIKSKD
jgi:hypothetical protein